MLRSQIAQLEQALAQATEQPAQVIPLVRPDFAPAPNTACASAMMPPRIAPPVVPGHVAAPAARPAAVTPQHIPLQTAHAAPLAESADDSSRTSAPEADSVSAAVPAVAGTDEPPSEGNAFAAAWADDQSSFEERFAARQFFHDDGPQSPSRKWLLG